MNFPQWEEPPENSETAEEAVVQGGRGNKELYGEGRGNETPSVQKSEEETMKVVESVWIMAELFLKILFYWVRL